MANSNSNIYDIQLQGANLNLNKFDSNIKQFTGFNKLNAPFFGDKLSPMWKKERTAQSNGSVFDNDGNEYYFTFLENSTKKILTKKDLNGNETPLLEAEKEGFEETVIESQYDILAVSSVNYNELENYIFVKFNKIYVKFAGIEYDTGIEYKSRIAKCKVFLLNNDKTVFCAIVKDYFIIVYDGVLTKKQYTSSTEFYSIWLCYPNNSILFSTGNTPHNLIELPLSGTISADSIHYTSKIGTYNISDLFGTYSVVVNGVTISATVGALFYEGTFYPTLGVDDPDFDMKNPKPKIIINSKIIDGVTKKVAKIKATIRDLAPEDDITFSYLLFADSNESVSNYTELYASYKIEPNSISMKDMCYFNHSSLNSNVFLYLKNKIVYDLWAFNDNNGEPVVNWGLYDYKRIDNNEWRILYNNEHISGISFGLYENNTSKVGTLLTEWNDIDEDFEILLNANYCVYKDNKSKFHLIKKLANTDLKIYNDYLFINTKSEKNCINIKNYKAFNFCNDWNNRVFDGDYGLSSSHFYNVFAQILSASYTTYDALKSACYTNQYTSAVNANYEITKNPFSSILLNPVVCYRFKAKNHTSVIDTEPRELSIGQAYVSDVNFVDIYISKDGGIPTYFYTYIGLSAIMQNRQLEGVQYPVDTSGNVIYNFPFFFSLIKSYVNKDFAVINGNGYPLIYYNNEVQFKYYFLSMFENLETAFVINGQTYCVSNNLVFSCTYQNGVISNIQSVVNVTNMKYLGCDTHRAYFWADMNKTVYTFSGANTLEMAFTADSINQVLFTGYNPTTNNIYVATDSGVYIFGQNGSYKITDSVVKQAYAWKKGMILQNGVNALYSFTKLEGFTKQNIELETEFYGLSSHQKSVTDCIYLRLFDEDLSKGEVSLKVESLTDGTRETEETIIKINNSDWDKLTKSVYVRYQPKRQRALGTSVFIDSPFAIGYMGIGNIADVKVIDSVSKTSINKPSVSAAKYNF